MRVLRSLRGPGRSIKFAEIARQEDFDMVVIYKEYINPDCMFRDDKEKDRVWLVDGKYGIEALVSWISESIPSLAEFRLYIYGNFNDKEIQFFKAWSELYENLSLLVTKELPKNVEREPLDYGPFVVEEA